MSHAFITVAVPFAGRLEKAVGELLDGLGKPAPRGNSTDPPCPAGLDDVAKGRLSLFAHFLSMLVVPQGDGRHPYLVIEVCADGTADDVLPRVVHAMRDTLQAVIAATGNATPDDAGLVEFLERHRVDVGTRLLATPGLVFTGTPEMSVRRILDERRLALRLREILEAVRGQPAGSSALALLQHARSKVFPDAGLKWAFVAEPVRLLDPPPPEIDLRFSLARAAWRDYLWALPAVAAVVGAVLVLLRLWFTWPTAGLDKRLVATVLGDFGIAALGVLVLEVLLVALVALLAYFNLRRQEESDVPFDVEPAKALVEDLMNRENQTAVVQNHLAGVSILKPGWARRHSLRLALWLITELQAGSSRPGFLNRIGSIHFARWVLLPGSDRLLFLSNYDGSWQSYLEDFIARLREGMSSVWSNTRDFPKTSSLFIGGARDGARFKRWARRQQVPTRFWYSAYPHLTTDRIRSNAAIRHGFASATTEAQAAEWLSLFGYAAPTRIEKDEACALTFGGLSPFRFAHCLVVQFRGRKGAAREWLWAIKASLSYGDHAVRKDHALVAAFTADGLRALGLDEVALATFPTAFQDGMSAPHRARPLGDEDPGTWAWGGSDPDRPVHAALIVYAKTNKSLEKQVSDRTLQLKDHGHMVLHEVRMKSLPEDGDTPVYEPFGFRDGISQPVMRGVRDWWRPEKKQHVVEPGELLLGYRDNLGNISPSPSSRGEDIGRNGTYLVIRQLEQDTAAFGKYVAGAAQTLQGDPRVGGLEAGELEHWVAATMVGRWRDGSSLVRYPHPPRVQYPHPPPPNGQARQPDNDFSFGREDPHGLRCPLGAHIRRANPRDSLEPGSALQLSISNRHRILRVGRPYEPDKGKPGLLFMCINADIERQFEFLQQTWILGANFHGLDDEIDPVVGYRGTGDTMTVPTARGPVRMRDLGKFVTMLGGGYFFVPGRSAVSVLADPAT